MKHHILEPWQIKDFSKEILMQEYLSLIEILKESYAKSESLYEQGYDDGKEVGYAEGLADGKLQKTKS